jgi:hypothetical protein
MLRSCQLVLLQMNRAVERYHCEADVHVGRSCRPVWWSFCRLGSSVLDWSES